MIRRIPEGWTDLKDYYVVSGDMEDTSPPSATSTTSQSTAFLALELLHHAKENLQMKGWRMILFGSLLAVAGVLQTANWTDILPAQYVGPWTALIGMAVIWLRSITNTPVGVK